MPAGTKHIHNMNIDETEDTNSEDCGYETSKYSTVLIPKIFASSRSDEI
jgi:hypothetical protein